MTLRDKEQEDRIVEVGNKLTSPPTDVQQLLLILDKADNLLSKVEQCPPQSMHTALQPSIKALISRNFLKHSDLDVKVAVASCLSEITRITAPDAPYHDDLMKEIFGLIVGSFKNLDEMSSRSFSKRVSILETVSKVRSCVLMLDLECDDLILDMFHHFLNTIRSKHSSTVFSSMETVMTLVIEESENISTRLLSCLLDHLKIDEKNIISSAKKLAEKVLVNCALKLKPYMLELFCGISTLSDYSKVVAAVCHGNLGTLIQNEMNSCEIQADDSKFSDRTHCDELPQGSAKQDNNVVCPEEAIEDAEKAVTVAEKVVADADGSSKSVTSNGTFQMGNGDATVLKQKTEFFQPTGQLRDTHGSILTESDNSGLGATKKPDSGLNLTTLKGRKRKASGKVVDIYQNKIDDKKEVPAITGRRKGRSKETDLSKSDGLPFKELETAACSKPGLDSVTASISLNSPNEHEGTQSRKGLPSRSKPSRSKSSRKRKSVGKAAVDSSSNASGHRRTLESSLLTNGDFSIRVTSSNKSEAIIESEKKLLQCSASKARAGVAEDSKTTSTNAICDSEINEGDGTRLTSVSLHIPIEHQGTHSRKGRLSRKKKYGKRNVTGKSLVDGSLSASVHKAVLESSQTTSVPVSEPSTKKSEAIISGSEKNLARSAEDSKTIPTTATYDSGTKHHRHRGKIGSKTKIRDVDLLGQKHITGTKQKKGGDLEDEEDKEVKLKELVSSRKSKIKETIYDQSSAKDSNETKSRLKRARDTQETFGTKKRRKSFNGMLVGSKIRVWWPDDESFYHGVVDSFDTNSKKHRILYDDGDVEFLFLKEEKWEPIEVEIMTDRAQEMNTPEVNASELTKKLKKGRRGKAPKTDPQLKVAVETKSNSPLKSPDTGVKTASNDKVPKRKGRPPGKALSAETHKNSSNGKGMSAKRHKNNSQINENVEKLEKEKVGRNVKSDHTKSADRIVNHSPKSGDKVDNRTPKKRGKSKVNSPNSSIKSKSIALKSMKKSGDADDSRIKSNKKEAPLRTESAQAPRKLAGRPARGSGRKAQTGRNLTANDTTPNDRAKATGSEAPSTIRKKRKRGRRGR